MKYIHYGSDKFDIRKFKEVENDMFLKPKGGLWASPVNSYIRWFEFCLEQNFNINKLKKSFIFELDNSSKILTIDSKDKLKEIFDKYGFVNKIGFNQLDFTKIAKDYDALEVLVSKDSDVYEELRAWDCDTLLVMNPKVIIEDKSLQKKQINQER